VVHGHGGLDEATLSGPSELRLLEDGVVRSDWVDPRELGLAAADLEALRGGDVAANRSILEAVLQGRGTQAQADVVALNTALVLRAAGLADSIAAALPLARQALADGRAWARVEALRDALAGSEG
jgi:anthranilate phosphoribosyltransferase